MIDRPDKLDRLQLTVSLLRKNADEGHMPYVTDALELIYALLVEMKAESEGSR